MTTHARTDLAGLLARSGTGDLHAFGTFYDLTISPAWQLARMNATTQREAEQQVEHGYIAAWRNSARFAAHSDSPLSWLLTFIQRGQSTSVDI